MYLHLSHSTQFGKPCTSVLCIQCTYMTLGFVGLLYTSVPYQRKKCISATYFSAFCTNLFQVRNGVFNLWSFGIRHFELQSTARWLLGEKTTVGCPFEIELEVLGRCWLLTQWLFCFSEIRLKVVEKLWLSAAFSHRDFRAFATFLTFTQKVKS